jgi:hypothetical protein
MSSGVSGMKHDEGKELQMQADFDLMEVEKLYSPDFINSYPKNVRKEAMVQNTSKKGTTKAEIKSWCKKGLNMQLRRSKEVGQYFQQLKSSKERHWKQRLIMMWIGSMLMKRQ